MGTRRLVSGVVTLAVAAVLGLSIFRAITAGPADVPRSKDLDNAKRQAATKETGQDFRQPLGNTTVISGQGIVEPADREVKVGSRVSGLVQKIWVEEGQRVAEGRTAPGAGLGRRVGGSLGREGRPGSGRRAPRDLDADRQAGRGPVARRA